MVKPRSFEYDLHYLQAGVEVLDSYLLSDEVFWPIEISQPDGEPAYPRLTLDGLLLARARLEAHTQSSDQQDQLDKLLSDLELQRSAHRVAWENKARQCFRIRMRMWADFLGEYRENPVENVDRYSYEVRLRVMLSLLGPEIGPSHPDEEQALMALDTYLKNILDGDGFIWDESIQAGFPRSEYWYLYGSLPPPAKKSKLKSA